MHNRFARTSNVKNFLAAYGKTEERGAREACWLLATGAPGLGKTRTVHWFSVNNNAIYLRAKANWRMLWMLQEIAGEFGLEAAGTIRTVFGQVLGALVATGRPLVIDEARNLLHDAKLLETLRDLGDMSENTIVLSGEEFVLKRLTTRYPQIRSRLSEVVEFRPASAADIRLVCDELAEVTIADDLVAEIQVQSSGFLREVKNAVAAVERFGKLQGMGRVEAKHVAGRRLCQDRTDVRVRSAGL